MPLPEIFVEDFYVFIFILMESEAAESCLPIRTPLFSTISRLLLLATSGLLFVRCPICPPPDIIPSSLPEATGRFPFDAPWGPPPPIVT